MIQSNVNVKMSREEIDRFYTEMERRMSGNLTMEERQRIASRKSVYAAILKRNGGVNPLFGR